MKTQTRHSLMLMLCAFIWGTAFVAQSAGSGMGAYSFLAGRSWLAVLVLIPTVFAFDASHYLLCHCFYLDLAFYDPRH